MGISTKTLYRWKESYCQICQALKRGKEIVDYEVENALLKRALGYTVKEERLTKDGEVVELTREIPGDVTAQIFWLKNRKPSEWKDKREDEEKQGEAITIINNIPKPNTVD